VGKVRTGLNLTGRKKKGYVEATDRGREWWRRKQQEDNGKK